MTKQELFDKFIEFMGEFALIKAVAALRDGFIMTTPFTIESMFIFSLLEQLQYEGHTDEAAVFHLKEIVRPRIIIDTCRDLVDTRQRMHDAEILSGILGVFEQCVISSHYDPP